MHPNLAGKFIQLAWSEDCHNGWVCLTEMVIDPAPPITLVLVSNSANVCTLYRTYHKGSALRNCCAKFQEMRNSRPGQRAVRDRQSCLAAAAASRLIGAENYVLALPAT